MAITASAGTLFCLYLNTCTRSKRHALRNRFAFDPKSKADNKPIQTAAPNASDEMYDVKVGSLDLAATKNEQTVAEKVKNPWIHLRNIA